MSESTKAWIFLIGLIVFFIVLLIVTLVVLFGGSKDEDDEDRAEAKKPEPKKADTRKTEQKEAEPNKSEDKKPESKKAETKKESKPAGSVSKQEEEAVHEDYGYEDEYYDEYDDEYYDDYEDDETGKTDELKQPDIPPIEEIPVVPEEKPVEKGKKNKRKDDKKPAVEDDIFTVAMDEDSIISRIEGDSEEAAEEDKAEDKSEDDIQKENYWYNKEEVADRPSYRKPEAYYHYFRSAFDSLDELLTEMYDCAYVKTEEIRFIAYGIEPKTIFGNEDLLVDEDAFIEKFKTKKPTMQDGVKIYEKWCGYVKSFLEIIEFHASKEMIEDINKKLCEYGKSDAKTLIKGK